MPSSRGPKPDAPPKASRRQAARAPAPAGKAAALAAADRRQVEDERERAVQELRRSEERFRMAFEEGPLGIVMIGPDGRLLQVNRAFSQMLGYPAEELCASTIYSVTHPDEIDRSLAMLAQMKSGRSPRASGDRRYLSKDGRIVSTRFTVSCVCGPDGEMLYALAVMEDVTERKRTEEALRRAERLASVGILAAGIAHEINNPLGAIVLSAEAALLSRQSPNGDKILQASLENIQTSAMRCGRIVKSVLQFARDEVSQKWPSSVADVARHARDMTRKLAVERSVTLRLELEEDCPHLVMNPTEMEQVLMNLISNAIEASDAGAEVILRAAAGRTALRITIEDHGQGMTRDEISHMFDPFFTTRLHQGGTGLGLSITHGIVQDHGGAIEVQSHPGRGTSVSLTFPIELCKA